MKRISPIRTNAKDSCQLTELKQSLQTAQSDLAQAYSAFDYASDPDLTDSCIYEIRSLQSRMDYLVKQIKEHEACAAAAAAGSARRTRWI